MTRILHILDHSLPAHSGYTFRTRAILKAQQEKGWAVAGVTGVRQPNHTLSGQGHAVTAAADAVDGLNFYRTPLITLSPSPLHEWREVAALTKSILAAAEDFRPDVLHAHSPVLCGMAAGRAAAKLNIPWIYEIRAFWEDAAVGNGTGSQGSAKYWLTRQLETRTAKAADAVVVICEGLRTDLIYRGIHPSKITVSPNGVDMGMFGAPLPPDAALRTELGLDGADVLGFIGSFYDYEGLDDLIAAMPALLDRAPNTHLLLVGGGPMEAQLRKAATDSPAARRIHFVGRVPHEQVERYYSLIDILVYPRKKMRLTDLVTPLKPLEAMAQGKLVAASDVGGHRELIRNGETGVLFAPDNPGAIAHALSPWINNRSDWDAFRTAGRAEVENHRNWSSNILRYEPVYQRLLSRKNDQKAA